MRHLSFLITSLVLIATTGLGQKFISEKSTVSFFSAATIENITATNTKATSIFDLSTGDIVFAIPIKDFQFDKTLMEEHFNEKYMETEKYPKATFQGKLIDFTKEASGEQMVKAKGKLMIHGVTKEVETAGTLLMQGNKVIVKSTFIVKLEDYQIMRPQVLWKNIAEQVEVTIDISYKPYEK